MTRRALLAAVAAAIMAPPAQAALGLEDFLRLSADLCGVPAARLDRGLAAKYLASVRAWARASDLAALSRGAGGQRKLAEAILECWYTGLYETGGGLRVAAYEDALAWEAAGVTPPTVCARA